MVEYMKKRKDLLPVVLLAASAVMAVLIAVKLTGLFLSPAKAAVTVQRAIEQGKSDPNNLQKQIARHKSVADELKKKNLFAPPPPRQHPVNDVAAIFGDSAFINDKWYKVGDKVADATIISIEPTKVIVEWDGQSKVFAPISAAGSNGGGEEGSSGRQRPPRPDGGKGPEAVTVERVEMGAGRAGGLSDAERERMRGEFSGMRERWQSMSDEEREAFRNQMRERFGGRRGGGEGGRPGGRRR